MTTPDLLDYIQAQTRKNIPKEIIVSKLALAGWYRTDIEEGFTKVAPTPVVPKQAPPLSAPTKPATIIEPQMLELRPKESVEMKVTPTPTVAPIPPVAPVMPPAPMPAFVPPPAPTPSITPDPILNAASAKTFMPMNVDNIAKRAMISNYNEDYRTADNKDTTMTNQKKKSFLSLLLILFTLCAIGAVVFLWKIGFITAPAFLANYI